MRPIALTTVKGGISRLRTKGAARPDALFDLVNGYVTVQRTVKVRPGTYRAALIPAATKGLTAADGKLHVFTTDPDIAGDIAGDGVTLTAHLITHPSQTDVADNPIELTQVHFAEKFMGALYVVAEFDAVDALGTTFHYWLQTGDAWRANAFYNINDIVAPTDFQGLYYKATRLTPANPVWTPNAQRAVGDRIEPTVPNGYYYTVAEVLGDNPQSGTTEPTWRASEGAEVVEDTQSEFDGLATPAPQPEVGTPALETRRRYSAAEIIERIL